MIREDLYKSIDNQMLGEKVYRSKLREDLNLIKESMVKNNRKRLIIETIYRSKIRNDLQTLLEKKTTVKHSSTGLNILDDLFMNSNLLSTLEGGFNTLTTSSEQRSDYKNHVIQAIINIFNQLDLSPSSDAETLSESIIRLFEEEDPDLTINVMDDDELPDDKIVGPEKRQREEDAEAGLDAEDEDENAKSIDPDEDLTGRNKAVSIVSKVEKSIQDYYSELGNPADRRDYQIYMLANLEMYFKTGEDSLSNNVDPDVVPDVDQAISDAESKLTDGEGDDEEVEFDDEELEDTEEELDL